jgi:uncharacterized protein DUF5906
MDKPISPPLPSRDKVPAELLEIRQWVCWRAVLDEARGKWRKPPASPKTGEGIGAVEKYREHFCSFDEAIAGAKKFGFDGVGWVFTDSDPYLGIDFDGAVTDGVIHAAVQTWLKWFIGGYTEFSPSGTGLHIICKGRLIKAVTATKLPEDDSTCEAYSTSRFFTWTSRSIGTCDKITDCQMSVDKLLAHLGPGKAEIIDAVEHAESQRPLSRFAVKKIHKDNLESLLKAPMGAGNAALNTCAFFAGRAFAAGALEGTEESIKRTLLEIVTKDWEKPHDEGAARDTIRSGWGSGASQPLVIKDEDYPQVAETLEELNAKFFLVKNFGNKARVCSHQLETLDSRKGRSFFLTAQSVNDFKVGYMNQLVESGTKKNGEPKLEDKASVWLRHRHRQEYDKIVFEPNGPLGKGSYNMWKGFSFTPKKGDCGRYLAHVHDNICQGDAKKYEYLIGWMAYAVRHPEEQGHVAVVVQGLKGVGKNSYAEAFAALFGQHGMIVSDQGRVTKNFNAHLRDKVVLVCDEAFFAGDRRHEGVLKALITGSTLTIEAKGVDAITCPNLLHLIIIGNDAWLVPASYEERRFLVLNCGAQQRMNYAYFQAINDQLNGGGYEALLHHLLHEVDLSKFNVREAPHTPELREQMMESLRGVEQAWNECLYTGLIPGKLMKNGTAHLRAADFIDWARKKEKGWSNLKPQHVGLLFGDNPRGDKMGFNFSRVGPLIKSELLRSFEIPPLTQARKLWDERRFRYPWPNDGGEWDALPETKF